jgi:hypothetical protein
MEDLVGETVLIRGSDGWAYEGKLDGTVPRGLIEHARLVDARFINWDNEETTPPTVEAVEIEGPVYIPVHLITWIHKSHLGGKKARKRT